MRNNGAEGCSSIQEYCRCQLSVRKKTSRSYSVDKIKQILRGPCHQLGWVVGLVYWEPPGQFLHTQEEITLHSGHVMLVCWAEINSKLILIGLDWIGWQLSSHPPQYLELIISGSILSSPPVPASIFLSHETLMSQTKTQTRRSNCKKL